MNLSINDLDNIVIELINKAYFSNQTVFTSCESKEIQTILYILNKKPLIMGYIISACENFSLFELLLTKNINWSQYGDVYHLLFHVITNINSCQFNTTKYEENIKNIFKTLITDSKKFIDHITNLYKEDQINGKMFISLMKLFSQEKDQIELYNLLKNGDEYDINIINEIITMSSNNVTLYKIIIEKSMIHTKGAIDMIYYIVSNYDVSKIDIDWNLMKVHIVESNLFINIIIVSKLLEFCNLSEFVLCTCIPHSVTFAVLLHKLIKYKYLTFQQVQTFCVLKYGKNTINDYCANGIIFSKKYYIHQLDLGEDSRSIFTLSSYYGHILSNKPFKPSYYDYLTQNLNLKVEKVHINRIIICDQSKYIHIFNKFFVNNTFDKDLFEKVKKLLENNVAYFCLYPI